jgi:hypothetical protein
MNQELMEYSESYNNWDWSIWKIKSRRKVVCKGICNKLWLCKLCNYFVSDFNLGNRLIIARYIDIAKSAQIIVSSS